MKFNRSPLESAPYPQPWEWILENIVFDKPSTECFFVDVGAHDGITYSNSGFMELDLGWSGICIEPHPDVFPKLQQNRNCKLINCCVSEINDEIEFLVLAGYTEMLSGILSKYDPKHIERINNELSYYGGVSTVVNVQSRTLTSILDEHNITSVDYLSVDVEGSELSVLKSLDLNKCNVHIISVENAGYSNNVREYLEKNGYNYLTKVACDEIYEKSR